MLTRAVHGAKATLSDGNCVTPLEVEVKIMAQNTTTANSDASEKPKKMTKAEFLVAMDEINATLGTQIAEMQENQRRIEANNEELNERVAETRRRIEAL